MKFSQITKNIKEVDQQKEQAKLLLSEIRKYFDFALIAGGAPRNWSYNKLANDFDIYVCRNRCHDDSKQEKIDNKIKNAISELSKKYKLSENKANTNINSNAYCGFILNAIHEFTISEQKCQFIIIDEDHSCLNSHSDFAERIFSTYDFGICMTSMDKDGNMYNDPMFEEDIKNKSFTVNITNFKRNNYAGMLKLVERFEKMENYFPDHKMRITV